MQQDKFYLRIFDSETIAAIFTAAKVMRRNRDAIYSKAGNQNKN